MSEPYKLGFIITFERCARCGAVWIPHNDFNLRDCEMCKAVAAIRFGKQEAAALDRLYPPTRIT
jgi:hypothetical protein